MKLRILHLEDNRDDIDLVRLALKRQRVDCELHAVSSGADYVDALENAKFDVILSDSGLPGYDGFAALTAARDRAPHTPFIVLSGYLHQDPRAGLEETRGIAARLAKSDLDKLGNVIQAAVAGTRPPQAETIPTLSAAMPPETQSAQAVEAILTGTVVQPQIAGTGPLTALSADRTPAPSYLEGMRHLVTVVQRLSLARNPETIMAIVRRAARELTGADGATFILRDNGLCHYADEDAISPLWKGHRFPMSACISGWAMLNRKPVAIEDIYQDPRIPVDAYAPTFVKSLVMVPIRTVDPIGAIGTYWAKRHIATADEISLLQALADSASIAMEAADLFANLERRVAERTEQLNARTGELERLNEEIEAFSYSVAHDLRSPLITIDGFARVLLECKPDTPEENRHEYLQRISTAAGRMYVLIDDLLSLSKIMRAPLIRTTVDLSSMAREIIEALRERAPNRKVELVIPNGITAHGDTGLLDIVLENLLSNAWKFTSKRDVARIEFGVTKDEQGVPTYFLTDNGAGFNVTRSKKLFAPFQRFHSQQEFPGTGIGLATVRRVIHRHGGELSAESQVDQGSTFRFTLPTV